MLVWDCVAVFNAVTAKVGCIGFEVCFRISDYEFHLMTVLIKASDNHADAVFKALGGFSFQGDVRNEVGGKFDAH